MSKNTKDRKKIFVCEDDEGIIELVQILMEEKGYHVMSCLTADDVFEVFDEFKPDLAILDLWMPRVSGEEITKYIKSHPTLKETPVIILSASREIADISNRVGADAFLAKPFDIDEFETLVEKFLA